MPQLHKTTHNPVPPWPRRLLGGLLGGVFIYAGTVKLLAHADFVIQLEKFGLFHAAWLEATAWSLAGLEIVAGLATLCGRRSGVLMLGLLLLAFLAALGHAWWRGLDVPCGCFGPEDESYRTSLQSAILRDLALLAGVMLLAWQKPGSALTFSTGSADPDQP